MSKCTQTGELSIRRFTEADRALYLSMAEAFYRSPAVLKPIPRSYMERTFDEMMRSDVYVDGFLLEYGGEAAGYMLIAKTFSQEPGGQAIWVEELSVLEPFQGKGLGSEALNWVKARYPDCRRIRLEVEPDNERAIRLYERLGYEKLDYYQMVWDAQ
ncbi:MAG: GNAT family N-acetyltransferase [Clostridiales bacterium]|nr:GNAT family N-acetyltransferase [Clostridiales bacterium]